MVASHVLSFTSTARFQSQLREAVRLRDDALEHEVRLLDPPETLEGPHWDAAILSLRQSLRSTLRLDGPLEELHRMLPNFSQDADAHGAVMEAKTALLHPRTNPGLAADFLAAFESLICDVVAPHMSSGAASELESLRYACFPTVRVQCPSASVASIRPHTDGMYGLQAGSVNYWLPLTPVCDSSALWVEVDEERDVGSARGERRVRHSSSNLRHSAHDLSDGSYAYGRRPPSKLTLPRTPLLTLKLTLTQPQAGAISTGAGAADSLLAAAPCDVLRWPSKRPFHRAQPLTAHACLDRLPLRAWSSLRPDSEVWIPKSNPQLDRTRSAPETAHDESQRGRP